MAAEGDADLVDQPKSNVIQARSELTPREASEYIAELVDELAVLARRSDLPMLAYLLDVAAHEAKTGTRELTGGVT